MLRSGSDNTFGSAPRITLLRRSLIVAGLSLTSFSNAAAFSFFTLAQTFSYFAHGSYGILNELWVNSEFRSQGVGEAVITYCENFARTQGWQRIDVSAPPMPQWDRSFAFYEKRGFEFTGRKLKYIVRPDGGDGGT